MKTETKAIVASALVVALALAAISGVTYSWFSDSEDATINVTTGTIEVDAKWSDFTLRSANIDGEKTVHIGDRDTFPYTSSTFYSAETAPSGGTKISVTAFMNPGDSFEFTISDIVLKNTIKAVFNYGYEIKVVDGPETIPFVVKHTTTDPEFNVPNITYAGSDTAREFSDNTITVTLPMECGNEYQGCSYQMEFYIVAVQSNSPDANITQSNSGAAVHDVTAGDNVVAVSPAEGVFDSATIQFNSGSSDGKIVVKTVDSTTEGITVSDGSAILAGVDVTAGGSEHALQGTNVRITFVIDGILPGNSISIYHDGTAITPSDLTVTSEDGKTTISFTTSDGFSAYYVAANYDAKVGSAYYEKLADAIADAEDGSTVTILRDIDTTTLGDFVGSETVQSMTIDLNGYDLTLTAASMTIKNGFDLEICNGYLDLQGPVSQYSNFAIESNSSLSLNSVSILSTGSVLYPRGDAATVCVNDSYIFTSGGYIIATNAASVENYNVSIIVKDSHLVCENTTVLLNVAGSLDISNSILEGELQCLIVRAGSANVSNTLFMFTPPDEDWIDTFLFRWSSGNCMTVSAIVVGNLNSTAYVADATLDLNNCELITGKDLDRSIVVAQDSKNGMIAKVTLSDNDGFDNIYTNNGSELTAVSSDVGEITMPVVTESA